MDRDFSKLTCDRAFGVFGLSFEQDSVVWATLTNGYLEIDDTLCRPVMQMEPFLKFLADARFSDDVSEETACLSRLACMCHYVFAHFAKYKRKRNTLVGYARKLCGVANSIFCQLIVMRYIGEKKGNGNLRTVFEALRNPRDDLRRVSAAYSGDDLYRSYCASLDLVSRVLCGCDDCKARSVAGALRDTAWGRRARDRRRRRRRLVCHLKGSPGFPPMHLPDIGHLSDAQSAVLLEELSCDVMQRHTTAVVAAGQLPLRLDAGAMGRDFMEKTTLILVYNVTFVLFLINTVRRLILFELGLCKDAFVREVARLRACLKDSPVSDRYLQCLAGGAFPADNLPNIMVSFMAGFKPAIRRLVPTNYNRNRVVLEYLSSMSYGLDGPCNFELAFARQLRNQILCRYKDVDFDGIEDMPDALIVADSVIHSCAEAFSFRTPCWFNSYYRSGAILGIVAHDLRRRRIASAVEEAARRKRERGRTPSWDRAPSDAEEEDEEDNSDGANGEGR